MKMHRKSLLKIGG